MTVNSLEYTASLFFVFPYLFLNLPWIILTHSSNGTEKSSNENDLTIPSNNIKVVSKGGE